MTVITKLKQTVSGLKSAQASLEDSLLIRITNKQSNFSKQLRSKHKQLLIL